VIFQYHLIVNDPGFVDVQQADFFVFQGSDEQVVFPERELVSGDEVHSADSDGRPPVIGWLSHAGPGSECGDRRSVIISAAGDFRPIRQKALKSRQLPTMVAPG